MFKATTIILSAAFILTGCATTSTPPAETISRPPTSREASPLNWSSPNAPHVLKPARPVAPGVQSKRPMAVVPQPPVSPAASAMTWVSVNRWAAEHKIGAPHLLSDMPVTSYALGSPNGVMILEIGSLEATWNGIEIHLGFEPQIIDDQVFVHGLDLEKNIAPLLAAPPLAFGTNRVIVVDPGHGGVNVGTHSVLDGRFEKEFTLDWARRLAPLLETNGWTVFLTRMSDVDISLSNRVAFAEAHHADLFISLHFNSAAPDQIQAGLETYCLTPVGMPSTLTRGYTDTWSQNYPNNALDIQNLQLAVRLHSALLRASDEEDRGVRYARFIGVLHGQHRPAVLIEAGYLSNPHEAKRIENPEFRQKLAEAVAQALK